MMMTIMELILVRVILAVALMTMLPWYSHFSLALDFQQVRQIAAKNNVTCLLVLGDSSVDSGNNNDLPTQMKSNFPPYGKDFYESRPTGRFSNGRLATDFIAEAVGYGKVIPPFLDPNLKPEDLQHGVSFASAATGYDDLTANLSSVLSVPKQLEYLAHYKIHLSKFVGNEKAEFIIRNAVYVVSMGTNDFLQNYFLESTRPEQFTLDQYQNFLISHMTRDFEVLHRLGARRLVVVGILPMGCIPLFRNLYMEKGCVTHLNNVASTFNAKVIRQLAILKKNLGLQVAFVDIFSIIQSAFTDPKKYGFEESLKGCCGTGTTEYGTSCKGLSTCPDPDKYIFWDAVHPTQRIHKIIADLAIDAIVKQFFSQPN